MLTKRKIAFYWAHIIVLCVQASLALVLLFSMPSEEKNAFFLGYSVEKLFLISIPLSILIPGILLIMYFRRDQFRLQNLDVSLKRILKPRVKKLVLILSCAIILVCFYLIAAIILDSFFVLSPPEEKIEIPTNTYYVGLIFESTKLYLQQLIPILYFIIGLATQALVFVYGIQMDIQAWKNRLRAQGIYTVLWVYGIFLIIWGLLNLGSRNLPLDLEGYSWHPLGVPILDRDVFLAFLIGFILISLGTVGKAFGLGKKRFAPVPGSKRDWYLDIVIGAIIWITAAIIWLSLPIEPNWFITEPMPPNFEFYPTSDALKHDVTAQNMLLGADLLYYGKSVMYKPLYAGFLGFLHIFAGPGLVSVSMLQSAVFAVFPVLVYLLTQKLHGRLAGIMASLLVIFREVNAIISASEISVSHSRQLMTDTPAAIGVLLTVYIVFLWIQKPNKYFWLSVVIGGLIASLMQVRNELLLLLPVILFFQVVIYIRNPRYWIKTSAFMVLGFVMIFVVWQIREMHFSGGSFLGANRVSTVIRQGQIRATNSDELTVEQPGSMLQKITSHFVHNQKQAFLIFPTAFRPVDSLIGFSGHRDADVFWSDCCSTENYIDRMRLFWEWQKWDGHVPQESVPAIMSTLFLISLGIAKSKEKQGVRALFPLFVVLVFYLLFSGLRISGGRRVQIVDWIWIVYYGIGLAHFVEWFFYFLFSAKAPEWLMGRKNGNGIVRHHKFEVPDHTRLRWSTFFSAGLVVLVIGALVPIIEAVIPAQFSEDTKEIRLNTVLKLEDSDILRAFLDNGGVAWEGRAFYPQYVGPDQLERSPDEGLPDEEGFLRFSLTGPNSVKITLPMRGYSGLNLPNASDVLVFGCLNQSSFKALAVYVAETDTIIFRNPLPEKLMCPTSIDH